MKSVLKLLTGAGACALVVLSCAAGDEGAGDKAYEMAKRATGNERRKQLKTAYMSYDNAIKKNPDRISSKLRERYLDMAITRAQMVLDEGSANMDAIPLLQKDIDALLNSEVPADLRQRYSSFLVQLGDTSKAKDKYINALVYYDKAIEKAADPAPFKAKRDDVIKNVAEENYQLGLMEFEMGKTTKEKDDAVSNYVKAEYYAKVALHFDSTFQKAQKLLADCYKQNRETYSAYISVIEYYSDTLVFKKVNKLDILIAIPDFKVSGGGAVAIVQMYNYSNNHLRMKSEDFALVDTDGKEYKAAASKMEPDFLEYEKEAKYTLRFPAPGAPVKKLIYRNGSHYTEKNFF